METAMLASLLKFISMNPDSVWIYLVGMIAFTLTFLVIVTTMLIKIIANSKTLLDSVKGLHSEEELIKGIRDAEYVNEALRTIKHDNFADRVSLLQVHNSIHSVNGIEHFKMSITHQDVMESAGATTQELGTKPMSMYVDIYKTFKWEGKTHIAIENISALHNDHFIQTFRKAYLERCGTQSVYFFPVKDIHGCLFGIGMVEYLQTGIHTAEINLGEGLHEARLESMERSFAMIGGMLSSKSIVA
jgi:hypothetical protein